MLTEREYGKGTDDYPVTCIQDEWLRVFFGYTDEEIDGMTRAEATAVLDQEWAEFDRTGKTRRDCGDHVFYEENYHLLRDPKLRPEEVGCGPIAYNVEVPAEEVPERRRRAVSREIDNVRDTFGLPAIEVRWFDWIESDVPASEDQAAAAARDARYGKTLAAFVAQGVRRQPVLIEERLDYFEPSHSHAWVFPDEPYAIFVEAYPTCADMIDMRQDLPYRIRNAVMLAYCDQLLGGLYEQRQMTDAELAHMARRLADVYAGLRAKLHVLRRSDSGCVLDLSSVLEDVRAVPDKDWVLVADKDWCPDQDPDCDEE